MTTETKNKILEYLERKKQVSAKELIDYLTLSPQAVFKQLSRLIKDEKIIKVGLPPKVFYSLNQDLLLRTNLNINKRTEREINLN